MDKPKISKIRHLLKAITWRLIATFITFILTWIITGQIELGFKVGVLDVIIKIILYYLHERAWYKSNFGVKRD